MVVVRARPIEDTGVQTARRLCHLQAIGAGGEGDHYPWRIKVNQKTGARTTPGR